MGVHNNGQAKQNWSFILEDPRKLLEILFQCLKLLGFCQGNYNTVMILIVIPGCGGVVLANSSINC